MNKESGITSFIYMGDPQCSRIQSKGSSYSDWGELLERALSEEKKVEHLLVLGGDIVNRGEKARHSEWASFLAAVDDAASAAGSGGELRMVTPVNGAAESISLYADRFINPGNGPIGHEKEFFSFDYGCCHFIVLNSDYMGNRRKEAYKFIGAWIRADLAVNSKPAVFAVMHHPAYTLGTSFEDDVRAAGIRDNYMKLLYRYGVDFILCGHQHAYARTREPEEENQVIQVMGVSGGKHFDARDKSSMAAVCEQLSVATIFETDGETINLKTIDKDGRILDDHVQHVRPPKRRKCGTCDRFSECGGTGRIELLEAEEKALRYGDPLKPANADGITVCTDGPDSDVVFFSDEELDSLEKTEVEYSVMRRGRLEYETKRGFRFTDLLEKTGKTTPVITENVGPTAVLTLTDSRGRQKILPLNEVLSGRRFGSFEGNAAPAIIVVEDEGYRLIYGQQDSSQYNSRGWMRDIRQIEIRA